MHWANVWPALSALFSGITALIALWAMFRWRNQEELKAKLNFKIAIADYAYHLAKMPETLEQPHIRHSQVDSSNRLTEIMSACFNAWIICEGLLDSKKNVRESWEFLFENHIRFINGELDKSILGEKCVVILNEKFVFK